MQSRTTVRSVALNRRLIAETGAIPAGLRLIRDTMPFEPLDTKMTVNEDAHGREVPVMRVKGLFQMGDLSNANGRYYSTREVLVPAVQSIQEDVSGRAVMGEFDHPADAKIHLNNVSHLITNIWMEGQKVYGEAEILHRLPMGACLRGLFEHKVRVGISSRGVGDMEMIESGGQQLYRVMPGYTFVTWDAVAEPSVSGAILHNIQEGLYKKVNAVKKMKPQLRPETYQKTLVEEINKYFGIK